MGLLGKIFKKDEKQNINPDEINQILKISNNQILDTESEDLINKFKHNLKLLVQEAKQNKKITKFAIIRNDDFLPEDFVWKVSSKNTGIEKQITPLTQELKNRYALHNANINNKQNGILIPVNQEKMDKVLSNIDNDKFKINIPVGFRSTKHFTVNTPLGVTGDYNLVPDNRTFTVIDGIKPFVNSGYAYSIAYHDAYLDVAHEGLPISKNAIILIEKSKYENIKDPSVLEQLKQRKLVVYQGDEVVAIDMILTELGILPSKVGNKYYEYDQEVYDILEKSIKSLADDNNIDYNKGHFSYNDKSHFTSYFDDKNNDRDESFEVFVSFLKNKLPECSNLIKSSNIKDFYYVGKIIDAVGVDKMLDLIEQYNNFLEAKLKISYRNYKEDRKNIDVKTSNLFKSTNRLIDLYYRNSDNIADDIKEKIEKNIILYMQGDTVSEQIQGCKNLSKLFNKVYNSQNIDEYTR